MDIKVAIVADEFNAMLRDLAAIDPSVEFRTVVHAMAIRVIQGAANRTRAATAGGIRAHWNAREWTTLDGKKYKLSWHDPDATWGGIVAKRADSLAVKLKSRGLAKRSWLELSKIVGAEIDVPSYVTAANYRGRTFPGDVRAQDTPTPTNYALTIINSSPIVRAAGGHAALIGSMAGESGYFRHNMEHRFFETLDGRCKKYPGIFVKNGIAA